MATKFFTKYPDADEKVWFKLNSDNENRLLDIESDTYQRTQSWTKYLTSYKERGFGIWFADGTVQPYKKNTTFKDTNKFKVYVKDDKYFEASLTPFSLFMINTLSADYKKNPYLIAIIAAYVSTYVCGISAQHMEFNKDTPGIITSIVRYHLYYQISKFLKDPSKLDRYISHVPNFVKKHKSTSPVWSDEFDSTRSEINSWLLSRKDRDQIRNWKYHNNPRGEQTGITYEKITGHSPNDVNDYKKIIATTTDGLTKIGQKLQQSVESYVYAVLGAHAKTRWPIVGEGAKSLQTQEVFRTIVKETIAQSDTTTTISNMRTAIASTNVVLNMAISPGMILVPSNLIIQKEKIPGYNNVLTLATDKMKLGKNTDVNYKAPSATTTDISSKTQVSTKTETSFETKESTSSIVTKANPKPKTPSVTGSSQRSVASEILGVTMMIGGFLFSKYIF